MSRDNSRYNCSKMQGNRLNPENRELLRNSAHHPYRTVVNVPNEKSALSSGWDRSLQIICKYKIIISIHPFPAIIRFSTFCNKNRQTFFSEDFQRASTSLILNISYFVHLLC